MSSSPPTLFVVVLFREDENIFKRFFVVKRERGYYIVISSRSLFEMIIISQYIQSKILDGQTGTVNSQMERFLSLNIHIVWRILGIDLR